MKKPAKFTLIITAITAGLIVIAGLFYSLFVDPNSLYQRQLDIQGEIFVDKLSIFGISDIKFYRQRNSSLELIIYIDEEDPMTGALVTNFVKRGYQVAKIESKNLRRQSEIPNQQCLDISEKLISIAHFLRDKYDIDKQDRAILIGAHGGATDVYLALAQSARDKFFAGISINFKLPRFEENMYCNVAGFKPGEKQASKNGASGKLSTIWYVFQDNVSAEDRLTNEFLNTLENARVTVEHDTSTNPIYKMLQVLTWLDSTNNEQLRTDPSEGNLPLNEVKSDKSGGDTLAILFTGDGGWAGIDKEIAKYLSQNGIPTVALSTLSYFWKARTPDETAATLEQLISHFTKKQNKTKVILIGYSFGANVLPFAANKLSPESKGKVALISLLGLDRTAAFVFHLSSWMNLDNGPNRLSIFPEIEKMQWAKSICVEGIKGHKKICSELEKFGSKLVLIDDELLPEKKYPVLVRQMIANIGTKME